MAFAGHCGLDIALPAARGRALAQLFAEEPGVVVQVIAGDEPAAGADPGAPRPGRRRRCTSARRCAELRVQMRIGAVQFDESWVELKRAWSETSWRMRRLRDDPQCADEEFAALHGGR